LANQVRVKVFDPHGTLVNRLSKHELLEIVLTKGKADITDRLQEIYEEASRWKETNELKLLIVLDETRLLKALLMRIRQTTDSIHWRLRLLPGLRKSKGVQRVYSLFDPLLFENSGACWKFPFNSLLMGFVVGTLLKQARSSLLGKTKDQIVASLHLKWKQHGYFDQQHEN